MIPEAAKDLYDGIKAYNDKDYEKAMKFAGLVWLSGIESYLGRQQLKSEVFDGESQGVDPRFQNKRLISDEEYKMLRAKTPTKIERDLVNRNIDDLIGTPDPALGLIITKRLEADHIVSMDLITTMDGFERLTYEERITVLTNTDNFMGLTKVANTSKAEKKYAEWLLYKKGNIEVDPEFRKEMSIIENEVARRLQKQIDDLNKNK